MKARSGRPEVPVDVIEPELGHIKRIGAKQTNAGFKAPLYQLTSKAYLATVLNQIRLEDFVGQVDEAEILTALRIFSKVLWDCVRARWSWITGVGVAIRDETTSSSQRPTPEASWYTLPKKHNILIAEDMTRIR